MAVYIIRAIGVDRIKIGVTDDPARRLAEIQAMSPVPLEIIDVLEGHAYETEATMHALASACHSHGEWFVESTALPIALNWFQGVRESVKYAARLMAQHIPPARVVEVITLLRLAGRSDLVADEMNRLASQVFADEGHS